MGKVRLEDVADDVDIELFEYGRDPHFEDYCGACDLFNTEQCPHFTDPNCMEDKDWKKQFKCDKFED